MEQLPTIDVKIRGKLYKFDANDFTAKEARLFRDALGVSFVQALGGAVDPLEMVAGFKWLSDRKDNPKLDYSDVAASISYGDIDFDETEQDDAGPPAPTSDPDSEIRSGISSPPSPISSASSPGR